MIKSLTIKDFIEFYSPCISCKRKTNLIWCVSGKTQYSEFKPSLNSKLLQLDLKITYYNRFQIMIDVTSHTVLSTDAAQLSEYCFINKCFFKLECNYCNSIITTNVIKFNLDKKILKPLCITFEKWHIFDDENYYHISTDLEADETKIAVSKINSVNPTKTWQRTIPAMSILKFASKEDFISRINEYMIFS